MITLTISISLATITHMDKEILEEFVKNNTEFSFCRSSGSGGQNVNNLNTKVQAKLLLSKLTFLSEQEMNLVRLKLKNRINSKDEIIIQVQQERKQLVNKEIAIRKIISLIVKSLKRNKKRIDTRPSKASKEKRLKLKKLKSRKKVQRNLDAFD